MNLQEVLSQLESWGTEQNQKIYKRHGASEPLYGVSFAHLKKLKKKIKCDQELAKELWKTKNTDAMTLALMIADPNIFTQKLAEDWLQDISYHLLGGMFGSLIAKTDFYKVAMNEWMKSSDEYVKQSGYNLLAAVLKEENNLSLEECKIYLDTIEKEIHLSPNRARYAMNTALICLGVYTEMTDEVMEVAKRIGKVEVDHGETSCKTPDAVAYIKKCLAHKNRK